MTERDEFFMRKAIELAERVVASNSGGPFGAIVVKDDEIIAEGYNSVTSLNDPTAHAEIIAIRKACQKLGSFQLEECTLYTSCEPCPMCLGAIYWARPKMVYYASGREDAAAIGFDDQFIYSELKKETAHRNIKFVRILRDHALKAFDKWKDKSNKIKY